MAGKSMILPATDPAAESGSTPAADGMGCALDSLVRPSFFAGQLLTDDDLTTLVAWSGEHQRLSRFRHGWGVVHGLDVRPDPKNAAQVLVGPGYAISRAGDDIVVCRETACDVIAARTADPQPAGPAPDAKHAGGSQNQDRPQARHYDFFGCQVTANEVYIFDLFLAYDEQAGGAVAALGAAAGGQDGPAMQATRMSETFRLKAQPYVPPDQPAPHPSEVWQGEFDACGAVLYEYEHAFPGGPRQEGGRGAAAQRWLLGWIARHPLQHFLWLADCIKGKAARDFDEKLIAETLFWIAQDRRTTLLARDCQTCNPEQDVRLARVWLHGTGEPAQRTYRVLAVAPHRRALGPDAWPARTGRVNLAQFMWRPYDEAYGQILDRHVRLGEPDEFELPDSMDDLRDWLTAEVIVERATTEVFPQLYTLGHDQHARMIVGFDLHRDEESE